MPLRETTGERGLYLPYMLSHVAQQRRKHNIKEAVFYGSMLLLMFSTAIVVLAVHFSR